MNATTIQGVVFSVAAVALAILSASLSRFDPQTELIVVAALIVVLGVPHGALDTIFAKQLYDIKSVPGWLGFGLVYVLIGATVVGLWYLQPAWFLFLFLLISATHFSGDPAKGTPWIIRMFYGGAIIVLPCMLHGMETAQLFSLLVGKDAAASVVTALEFLLWPWMLGLAGSTLWALRINFFTALEITVVSLLAVLAPPLIAFVMFFCGMHSARHILRTIEYSNRGSAVMLLAAGFVPMLGVACSALAAWYFLRNTTLDVRVVQIVFVGLAALTLPHMALVEQVRFSGWMKGARKRS
jgi:Brp/Blh family beta-carotene 15,15'-monooxygenase